MPTTRRRMLAMLGAASTALAGCLSGGSSTPNLGDVTGTWPMVGRDSGHTRAVAAGPTDPSTAWTTTLDGVRSVGAPALVGGALYVPVDAVSERARHRYRIHALAAATGDERWQVPLRAEPNGPPAVRGDRVVVTGRPSTDRGRVVGFETRYGGEEWLYDVDARITAPPTIRLGTAYVPDWRGRVHALSVGDGSVLWTRRIGADESGRQFPEPVAVRDRTLYLGSQAGDTGVLALDAGTGAVRWRRDTPGVTGGPIVDDDSVVVRAGESIVGFALDGTRQFTVTLPEPGSGPMAIDDGTVYAPAGDALYAIDRDGTEAWRYENDGQVGPPVVVGDAVVVRGEGELTGLSRGTGDVAWATEVAGTGSIVVTRRGIFASGENGTVVALGES